MKTVRQAPHETNRCPLCHSITAATVSETDYSLIWQNLGFEWGATFSDETITAHSPATRARLQHCEDCGLQYFSPAVAGSAYFYAELTSSCKTYYVDEKWEFARVRKVVTRAHRVLDVACGKGAFLNSIASSAAVAVGVDTNPDAAAGPRLEGVKIHNDSIHEFSKRRPENFDVVTAFQVIEHLGDIMPFVEAAYRCVVPGGTLVLSVPNRERRRDDTFGSLDFPPHHLSRWSEEQLRWVARQLNASSVTIARERLSRSQTIAALRRKELANMLKPESVVQNAVSKILSRLLVSFPFSMVWTLFDLQDKLAMHGHSLLAVIRKPATASPMIVQQRSLVEAASSHSSAMHSTAKDF